MWVVVNWANVGGKMNGLALQTRYFCPVLTNHPECQKENLYQSLAKLLVLSTHLNILVIFCDRIAVHLKHLCALQHPNDQHDRSNCARLSEIKPSYTENAWTYRSYARSSNQEPYLERFGQRGGRGGGRARESRLVVARMEVHSRTNYCQLSSKCSRILYCRQSLMLEVMSAGNVYRIRLPSA